jgi:hypothetical protein
VVAASAASPKTGLGVFASPTSAEPPSDDAVQSACTQIDALVDFWGQLGVGTLECVMCLQSTHSFLCDVSGGGVKDAVFNLIAEYKGDPQHVYDLAGLCTDARTDLAGDADFEAVSAILHPDPEFMPERLPSIAGDGRFLDQFFGESTKKKSRTPSMSWSMASSPARVGAGGTMSPLAKPVSTENAQGDDFVLTVGVMEAAHLSNSDQTSKSDPFVSLSISTMKGIKAKKTATVQDSLYPKWNESIDFDVGHLPQFEVLEVKVFDDDGAFEKAEVLGGFIVPLGGLGDADSRVGSADLEWHQLHGEMSNGQAVRGRVLMSLALRKKNGS